MNRRSLWALLVAGAALVVSVWQAATDRFGYPRQPARFGGLFARG